MVSHSRVVVVSSCLIVVAAVASALAGPFTDKGSQPPLTHVLEPSINCAGCHGSYDDFNAHEPWDSWAGSMMAQSGRDPLFWAALDVANNDVADIGDWCLRCHAPNAWYSGRSEPPGGTTDGCGMQGAIDQIGGDFDGVSCHACHRMMINDMPPLGEDSLYTENGSLWLDDSDCDGAGEPCRRGPYDYPADGAFEPLHAWKHSTYHEESTFCGSCHNVTNPVNTLWENGVDTGIPFPIERTFSEWQQSDYADSASGSFQSCQGCHMPDATQMPAYACVFDENDHSGDLATHEFAGGNAWVPEVLRNEYPGLNLDTELARTRDWALNMLQNESATVETTVPAIAAAGGDVTFDVKVTNLTGHKLPTGYPEGRRMWINVQIRDATNQLLWESGAYDGATGVLTEDAQIKVYESKQGIFNYNGTNECDCEDLSGDKMFHFVLNNCVELDNRIPPLGFKGGSDIETQPKNYTYPETYPGSGILVNYDVTQYTAPIPLWAQSPITISATLRYQTTSKDYVEFLRDEAVDNSFPDDCFPRGGVMPTQSRGEILHDMWTTYDRSPPVDMTTGSGVVPLTPAVDAPIAASSVALALGQNSPNPVRADRGGTRIAYVIPRSADVELHILDVQGRRVRTLSQGFQAFGPHSAHWDGRDDQGRLVASGVYMYRLEVAGQALTRRMILVR